ncbi:MAG TPA: hypothetical protein VFA68_08910 [Terriglobales bacterium]|nr:hypothetical protein [Terriglobales bacterium]
MPSSSSGARHVGVQARLLFRAYSGDWQEPATDLGALSPEFDYIVGLDSAGRQEFLRYADMHHVTVRVLRVIRNAALSAGEANLREWCDLALKQEHLRIDRALSYLAPICAALDLAGCTTTVIKSLDHWPDLGSDLDLYTSGDADRVSQVMTSEFKAKMEARSWGDRLANKWNFAVPGLPELIEIHVQYLGQTGEQTAMAKRVVERNVARTLNGRTFRVPAPEERVLISTLQRMYRHFYFRLCDMADFTALLQSSAIDFAELRRAAASGGIWPGVATFLFLVWKYAEENGGTAPLPEDVSRAAYSSEIRVHFEDNFLRVPKLPAASLYGSQLLCASMHRDLRAMLRLPLLPPLAVSALVAYRLTGSDKGVW